MKVFTQAEFDAMPVEDGIKQCLSGDYRNVDIANQRCIFAALCIFGEGCRFGGGCSFGEGCIFGEWCRFAALCRFGVGCRFGGGCSFGERCRFCGGCSFEGEEAKPGHPYIAIDGAGSVARKSYFFNLKSGIRVRSGCFVGTLQEFRRKVLDDCGPTEIKALQYLGFANIAAVTFGYPELVDYESPTIGGAA